MSDIKPLPDIVSDLPLKPETLKQKDALPARYYRSLKPKEPKLKKSINIVTGADEKI